MTLILDIDFDVFVNPVARNLDENGPRLQEDQYNIDNTESIIDYIHSNLRYDNWNRGSVQVHHVETLATIENEILTSLLQKHMKPHCMHYILHIDVGCGTLCSTALSIGVVSAKGSNE